MNGLLRRLADQMVNASTPRAHAPSRLPFAVAERRAFDDAAPESDVVSANNPGAGVPGAAHHRPATPASVCAGDFAGASRDRGMPRASSHNDTSPRDAEHSPRAPAPLMDPEPITDNGDASPAEREPASNAVNATATPQTEPEAAASFPRIQTNKLPPLAVDAPPAASGARPRRTVVAPEPLVNRSERERQDRQPVKTRGGEARAPRAPGEPQPPPRTERTPTETTTPEVHVHIGRIEVTAIQESAPARRKPRGGPAPMSLDDYLKRRSAS